GRAGAGGTVLATRMSSRSMLRALPILLAASACMVGPDYVRPQVPLDSSWSGKGDPRLATNTAIEIAWWKRFQDPALDRLIDLAYEQTLTLQIAGLRILEARAQIGIAEGQLSPSNRGPIAPAAANGVSSHAANAAVLDRRYGDYLVGFDAIW